MSVLQRLSLLPAIESLAPVSSQPTPYTAPDQSSQQGLVLSDLPKPAVQALQKLLPHWKKVGASYRKMQRAGPVPPEALEALLKLADASAAKSKAAGTTDAAGELSTYPCCDFIIDSRSLVESSITKS